jgi:hypothetical protein
MASCSTTFVEWEQVNMEISGLENLKREDAFRLIAFYEIARRANLTNHPELLKSPIFQKARALYDARAQYLLEGFGKQEAIDDYLKFHLEGALASQGKKWEDVWAEFAPEALQAYPLAPGAFD